MGANPPLSDPDVCRKWIFPAALIALWAKLAIAYSTLGSNDIGSFYMFAGALFRGGVAELYAQDISFNHSPLVAYYLRLIYGLAHQPFFEQHGITFPFLLRLPGIFADAIVVLLLARWRIRLGLPGWSLLLLALSPISIMVSGFHGNTDPVMVLFLVLAATMCLWRAPALCGVALAISCQIKIIPLFLVPIFACYWFCKGRIWRFSLLFAVAILVLSLEPILQAPIPWLRNVVFYGGFWGAWGITYLLHLTGRPEFGVVDFQGLPAGEILVMKILKAVIVAGALVIAWRRRRDDAEQVFRSVGVVWLIFFVFSPAVAPQYMVWLVPFVLVLSPALGTAFVISGSVALWVFYQTTAGRFPWYAAVATPDTNAMTAPWMLLPWVASIVILSLVLIRGARLESTRSLAGAP